MPAPLATTSAPAVGTGWLGFLGPTAVWLAAVTLGFVAVEGYLVTPGETAPAPARWPTASRLPHASDRPTLLLFAHPRCPCTRATVGELELVMARNLGRVEARVLFVRPPGVRAGWERTPLWERTERIPGVLVQADEGGAEATTFGALTSGEVRVYDASGALRFAGGITGARGHSGDNPGRAALEDHLSGRTGAAASTPVFGCPLLAPPARGTKEAACAR